MSGGEHNIACNDYACANFVAEFIRVVNPDSKNFALGGFAVDDERPP